MIADLIYDVGMHNGHDTAHYLSKGFRVIAVEADPALVELARERFAEPIRSGQLQLLNVAIGPNEELAKFWICDAKSEWNSFDVGIASRYGLPCHSIIVQCLRFRSLLERYGVPCYLKIDIEGNDQFCVSDLDPHDLPRYLSFEMGHLEHLFALRQLGYTRFKLILQNDHSQLAVDPFSAREWIKRGLRDYPRLYRAASGLVSAPRRLAAGHWRPGPSSPNNGRQQYPSGSSGPFGEETDGPWRTLDEVAYTWVAFQLGHSVHGTPGLHLWNDVHVARDLDVRERSDSDRVP